MCVARPLLRSVLVVLLLAFSYGKRGCNYKEILGSYREIILVELQNLVGYAHIVADKNLTGSLNTSKERDHCPSGKAHHILRSIYVLTQQFRCQRAGSRQRNLEKPVESMEQLISHNCSHDYLGKRSSCQASQKTRGKKRRRIKLIKVIRSLITCWQKLQSIYAIKTKDK